jgi:hypothetical protein
VNNPISLLCLCLLLLIPLGLAQVYGTFKVIVGIDKVSLFTGIHKTAVETDDKDLTFNIKGKKDKPGENFKVCLSDYDHKNKHRCKGFLTKT